jgi:hypothetical protein
VYEELQPRHELVFELVEKSLYLCSQGEANDFAVLRVRKGNED